MEQRSLLLIGGLLLALSPTSLAQFSSVEGRTLKALGAASVPSTSGFLSGADDCSAPHEVLAPGNRTAETFVTGTTGSEGQGEAACYQFGTTGIDNDVWFDWMATQDAVAQLRTCGGTTTDTKMAVWPGAGGCPVDGTSIACNDDACALQSTVTWNVRTGVTYTFQIGTFPGAAGGSGTFEVRQLSPGFPCGQLDDGVSENATGLSAGGETGWLQDFGFCMQQVDGVETAYGTPGGASPPNGSASRLAIYEDPTCGGDPSAGTLTLVWSTLTSVTNAGQDLLVSVPVTGVGPGGCFWALATADHAPGEFPAPMDETNPSTAAWIVGDTAGPGSMDLADLSANSNPPVSMAALGMPSSFLLRIQGVELPDETCLGGTCVSFCWDCPCGNQGASLQGCANSTGEGANLIVSGTASLANDSLALTAAPVPNQPGVFFQANAEIQPTPFGAGLRCCGGSVLRIGTYMAANQVADTASGALIGGFGPPISQHPGNASLQAGDVRCYQYWFRDPGAGNPCPGTAFNLSRSQQVFWSL